MTEPCLYALAGTNGAGKSSVGGATIRAAGADYYNPDEATNRIMAANPGMERAQANGIAWLQGRRLLERAIAERLDFAFETTLGGSTITRLLEQAAAEGMNVRIWYVGLNSPDLHIARVQSRVACGGHDIPEGKIRERYDMSRLNLIRLFPLLAEVCVFDNSHEGDPKKGVAPRPVLILHMARGRVLETCELERAPSWTHPVLAAALGSE